MTYSISYKDKDWLRCRESVTQSAYFNGTHKFWDLPVCLYLSKAADNNSMPENDFFLTHSVLYFQWKKQRYGQILTVKFWQCENHDYTTRGGFKEADAVIGGCWFCSDCGRVSEWKERVRLRAKDGNQWWGREEDQGWRNSSHGRNPNRGFFEATGKREKGMEIGYCVRAREHWTILS